MKPWVDSDAKAFIRWFRVPRGREGIPYWHGYSSTDWQSYRPKEDPAPDGIGVYFTGWRYDKGRPPVYRGRNLFPCGSPEAWAGTTVANAPPLLYDLRTGVAICCGLPTVPVPPPLPEGIERLRGDLQPNNDYHLLASSLIPTGKYNLVGSLYDGSSRLTPLEGIPVSTPIVTVPTIGSNGALHLIGTGNPVPSIPPSGTMSLIGTLPSRKELRLIGDMLRIRHGFFVMVGSQGPQGMLVNDVSVRRAEGAYVMRSIPPVPGYYHMLDPAAGWPPDPPHGDMLFTSSDTWTCPDGVTSVTAHCWGGGGSGNGGDVLNGTGGGGGAAYASSTITVSPGATYNVEVGIGGAAISGGPSWFSNTNAVPTSSSEGAYAEGGLACVGGSPGADMTGGRGGKAANCIGSISYDGGDGGNASVDGAGGAGGGSAFHDGPGSRGDDGRTSGSPPFALGGFGYWWGGNGGMPNGNGTEGINAWSPNVGGGGGGGGGGIWLGTVVVIAGGNRGAVYLVW